MDSFEKVLLGFIILLLVFLSYLLGYTSGLSADYRDAAVIREVGTSNRKEGKYVYSTNQFDFVSDSIYLVGDTVKITRY